MREEWASELAKIWRADEWVSKYWRVGERVRK